MPVKNNLKDIRHDHRMNQVEFAKYLDAGRSLYNRWERQHVQPELETVLKIAKKIGRSVEDIVYLDE